MTSLPVAIEHGSEFEQFLRKIQLAPMLSAEEELQLATRYNHDGDVAAAHILVFSHLRLVVKTAREYLGYHLPLPDLVQEGALGLMQAVKRFDPTRGVRLATYGLWWIRAAIHEFILSSWSLVKIGTTQLKRKLFFKLRQSKESSARLNNEEAELLGIKLGADAQTILEMDARLSGNDDSLNRQVMEGADQLLDLIPDHRPNQEALSLSRERRTVLSRLVREGLLGLDPRERIIIQERFLQDEAPTLEALGQRMAITRERVRQLEKRAIKKLQGHFLQAPECRELFLNGGN